MTRLAPTQKRRGQPQPKARTHSKARSRSRRSPAAPAAVGLVLAVIAVALVAAIVAGGGGDTGTGTGTADDAADSSGATGDAGADAATALPPYGDGAGSDDPAIGMSLPELAGTDVDGEPMAVATDGRPKLVVFLAHWCPHCQREVPVIQDWVDAGRLPTGVDLVAVATAMDERRPNHPADAWLAREGWTNPVLYDHDDRAAGLAGLTAFPYFVVTDADGTVLARATGELAEGQLDGLADLAESGA